MRPALAILLSVLMATACRSSFVEKQQDKPESESQRAIPATPISSGQETGLPKPQAAAGASSSSSPGSGKSPAFQVLSSLADPSGDSGEAPTYADVVSLTIEDDGNSSRVAIEVSGKLPTALARGEVVGIGVDFFRGPTQESNYQLFADGGEEGWFAYLQTPSGFIDFPGTFQIGETHLVFVVPWRALGDIRRADFSLFCDWSKSEAAPLSKSATDLAPDSGRSAFQR